uniref:Uncharacterized protein n=1 Tax=Solanum tuberosum TaxID=4113 RepID=M1DSQ5_SOLTU
MVPLVDLEALARPLGGYFSMPKETPRVLPRAVVKTSVCGDGHHFSHSKYEIVLALNFAASHGLHFLPPSTAFGQASGFGLRSHDLGVTFAKTMFSVIAFIDPTLLSLRVKVHHSHSRGPFHIREEGLGLT